METGLINCAQRLRLSAVGIIKKQMMNSKMHNSTIELPQPPAVTSAPIAENRLLPAATGVKGYSLFEKELFDWYRENKPNSGLPSRIVVGILYDDYLKAL